MGSNAPKKSPAETESGHGSPLAYLFPGLATVDYTLPVKAYYINLKSSSWRRGMMESTFGKLWGMDNLIRVAGVDGSIESEVTKVMDDGKASRAEYHRHCFKLTESDPRSAFGAALSHLLAIQRAYLDGEEIALIMEDDVAPYFMPYWTFGVMTLLTTLENHPWESIQLQYTVGQRAWDPPPSEHLLGGNLYKVLFQWGAGAYLISRKGMDKVLEHFFTNKTVTGKIIPVTDAPPTRPAVIDGDYFRPLLKNNYATVSLHKYWI